MTKKAIRNAMREQLANLDKITYTNYSRQIEEHFLRYIAVSDVSTIAMTISSFPEVDTSGIIKHLWDMEKNVVVPKCNPSDKTMIFYQIQNFNQLEQVYMHLLEPKPEVTKACIPEEIDLIVVPGIVYSKTGYRVGYGGGYYDRYLVNYTGDTLSLGFDIQIVDTVVTDVFDLPVNKIITPTEIVMCKQMREKGE